MRPKHRVRKLATIASLIGLMVVGVAAPAMAQETDPVTPWASQLNLLWIVIGAVLVIFMQAGFALVETGFSRAKHAAHVVSTNFAIFGIGFVAYFLVGYAFMFGGFSYVLPGFDFGYDTALGGALIGSGDWTFLWQGRFSSAGSSHPGRPRLLSLYGGVHGHHGDDPHRLDGGTVEVERASSAGACSAGPSTTRCSAHGPGAEAG